MKEIKGDETAKEIYKNYWLSFWRAEQKARNERARELREKQPPKNSNGKTQKS